MPNNAPRCRRVREGASSARHPRRRFPPVGLRTLGLALVFILAGQVAMAQNEIVSIASAHSFGETLGRLQTAMHGRGFVVFATIDHAAGAAEVGLALRPTTVLIFGNPRVGTLLMQAQQTMGLDLPLKMLTWEDGDAKVWITYEDPAALARRRGVDSLLPPIPAISAGLAALAAAATAP